MYRTIFLRVHGASVILGLAVCAFSPSGNAAQVSTLYNTGVDATGTVLPGGTIGDPHYTLIEKPSGTADIRVIDAAAGYPIPPYLGDNTLSRWIGPNNASDLVSGSGRYVYRTTFDLTGLDPASASILGSWSTDNSGLDILINGLSLGFTTADAQFSVGMADFAILDGFVTGLNTLDFVVNNREDGSPNPTALRVEMAGTAAALSIPEPSTTLLLGLGLACMAASRMRLAR